MKFDDKWPNAKHFEEFDFEGSSIMISKEHLPEPCWNCGDLTTWYDLSFEARLCSEECSRTKWKEYFTALKSTLVPVPAPKYAPSEKVMLDGKEWEIITVSSFVRHGMFEMWGYYIQNEMEFKCVGEPFLKKGGE